MFWTVVDSSPCWIPQARGRYPWIPSYSEGLRSDRLSATVPCSVPYIQCSTQMTRAMPVKTLQGEFVPINNPLTPFHGPDNSTSLCRRSPTAGTLFYPTVASCSMCVVSLQVGRSRHLPAVLADNALSPSLSLFAATLHLRGTDCAVEGHWLVHAPSFIVIGGQCFTWDVGLSTTWVLCHGQQVYFVGESVLACRASWLRPSLDDMTLASYRHFRIEASQSSSLDVCHRARPGPCRILWLQSCHRPSSLALDSLKFSRVLPRGRLANPLDHKEISIKSVLLVPHTGQAVCSGDSSLAKGCEILVGGRRS
ncbi:hypothetical protein CGRA01v4_13296 [Colletotrichum graminicola]|nr:hypothetical protein CGRA01v4_13296 [Colletotrichum graminicola]